MTEIALRQTAPPPMSLPDKIAYCEALSRANALPTQYRGRPADLLFAVEYADSLGLHPIAAVTGIQVIEGKPTASAGLISMLVRRAGHKLRINVTGSIPGRDLAATAELVRADDPAFAYRATWDLQRAVRAGLCTVDDTGNPRARSKDGKVLPWEKYPEAMLKARAITEVGRDGAEDALLGVHYTAEEMGAVVDEDGTPVHAEPDQPAPTTPRPPAPAPTARSGDRYNSPQQSATQTPASAPAGPLEPMPDDLRDLLFAAWSDLDADEARQVWRLCIERGVDKEAPTADDRGQPTTMRALFSYAGRRILEGERPAGVSGPDSLGPGHTAESAVDGVVILEGAIDAPLAREQKRAERLPKIPPDDPWYADQPEPVADGSHPMDLPIPEPEESPSAAAREAARNATRRVPASSNR